MKNPKISVISAAIAALAAVLCALSIFFIEKMHFHSLYIWLLIPFIFLMVFGLSAYLINAFLFRKIKLLYKLIYREKAPDTGTSSMSFDIDKAEKDVKDYLHDQGMKWDQMMADAKFKKEFLGNVSHELQTPIYNIQGYLDVLLDGGTKDKKISKDYLLKAIKNADRLEMIVKDLLKISQFESGKEKLQLGNFNITELAKECAENLEMKADNHHIKIGIKKGCDHNFYVKADLEKIRHVFMNLIDNAIKYGNLNGHVWLGFYDMGKRILIEVSDDGPGIDEHHLNRLFERFYRIDAHRSRDEGGTGLGLAIVKHIMDLHHQKINVRSKKEVGTTFAFSLDKA